MTRLAFCGRGVWLSCPEAVFFVFSSTENSECSRRASVCVYQVAVVSNSPWKALLREPSVLDSVGPGSSDAPSIVYGVGEVLFCVLVLKKEALHMYKPEEPQVCALHYGVPLFRNKQVKLHKRSSTGCPYRGLAYPCRPGRLDCLTAEYSPWEQLSLCSAAYTPQSNMLTQS